jgi:hypothetical protein
MAKKKVATKKDDGGAGVFLLAIIIFIPFLVFSFLHYKKLKRDFPLTESSQRIFDLGNLIPALALTPIGIGVIALGFNALSSSNILIILLGSGLVTAGIWVCYHIAKSIASAYFGVIVDPIIDLLILSKDMANYNLEDYLKLRFIHDLGVMEQIPLSEVTKITREAGKKLYVHGEFGSRGIAFSNKQKRDECIAAIERCRKKSITSVEFEMA